MKYLDRLPWIASVDIEVLKRKEETYQGSWKKRGGVGAFMMLARKWDRLEQICSGHKYDIFQAIGPLMDGHDGTALAEIRDLRRYLMLVEAEMMDRNNTKIDEWQKRDTIHVDGTPKEDSNRHAAAAMDSRDTMASAKGTAGSSHPKVHQPRS